MTQDQFDYYKSILPYEFSPQHVEFKGLMDLTSAYLIKYKCCLFHSVSFIYKDKAWLLSAPSGTGKTTQFLNWKTMFPDEIEMISGDMPVLELKNDHTIMVHPSAWNGKENIHSFLNAPLGGVFYLRQSDSNQICKMNVSKGVVPLLNQFGVQLRSKTEILAVSEILDCMFRNQCVYGFDNTGTYESTKMLKDFIDQIRR
jgi:energy-coupling factor transporter ATP-binding protein EcfA2